MRQAYIYVSTLNPELEQGGALALLNRNRKEWQSRIGRRLGLKFTPQLIFRFDTAIERGDRVMEILTKLEREKESPAENAEGRSGSALRAEPHPVLAPRPRALYQSVCPKPPPATMAAVPISFVPSPSSPASRPHAAGSVLAKCGRTQVICAVTIEESVPRWMKEQQVAGGWITAEYSMLPYSTLGRKPRDITKGRLDGRSTEIQRLIGRSVRAACRSRGARARAPSASIATSSPPTAARAPRRSPAPTSRSNSPSESLRKKGLLPSTEKSPIRRALRRHQRRHRRRPASFSISITSRTRTPRPT